MARTAVKAVSEVTNGAAEIIGAGEPYSVLVELTGTADFLFHRWNCEAVEEKSKAAKEAVRSIP